MISYGLALSLFPLFAEVEHRAPCSLLRAKNTKKEAAQVPFPGLRAASTLYKLTFIRLCLLYRTDTYRARNF